MGMEDRLHKGVCSRRTRNLTRTGIGSKIRASLFEPKEDSRVGDTQVLSGAPMRVARPHPLEWMPVGVVRFGPVVFSFSLLKC